MTQYDDRVERQRDRLAAEKWAKGIKSVHIHSLKSMWYDDRPQDTDDGSVTDTIYNNGVIERKRGDKILYTWTNDKLTTDDLIREYIRDVAKQERIRKV